MRQKHLSRKFENEIQLEKHLYCETLEPAVLDVHDRRPITSTTVRSPRETTQYNVCSSHRQRVLGGLSPPPKKNL